MDVLCTSPWIPPEWIKAHGLEPREFWNLAGAVTPKARGQGTCAYSEGCLECATRHPEHPVIFDTSCDQLRRAFDVLQMTGGPGSFLFNLPATWQAPPASRIFRSELDRLSRWLQTLGGAVPDKQRLLQIIDESQSKRCRWRAELSTLKEVLGRPICLLEEDTLTGCSSRNLNRVQAFLEVLR